MDESLEKLLRLLSTVLQDAESSLLANQSAVNALTQTECVSNGDDGSFQDKKEVAISLVESICNKINDNLVQLGEATILALDRHAEARSFLPVRHAFTNFAPGERIVVGKRDLRSKNGCFTLSCTSTQQDMCSLNDVSDRFHFTNNVWVDSIPCFVADHYISGQILSISSTIDNGKIASIVLDVDKTGGIVTAPLDCLLPYENLPLSTKTRFQNLPEVGKCFLIESDETSGLFEPAILIGVNNQYCRNEKQGPDSSHTSSQQKRQNFQSELIFQQRNNKVTQISMFDIFNNCRNVLHLGHPWAASNSALLIYGFVLCQTPLVLQDYITSTMTASGNSTCGLDAFRESIFFAYLSECIQQKWQSTLQRVFYRADRESVSLADLGRKIGTMKYENKSCGLIKLIHATKTEIERVGKGFIGISSNTENSESNADMYHWGKSMLEKDEDIIVCDSSFTPAHASKAIPTSGSGIRSNHGDKGCVLTEEPIGHRELVHISRLFEDLFVLVSSLLDSVHNDTYEDNFLAAFRDIEQRGSDFSSWLDECEESLETSATELLNDDVASIVANCDQTEDGTGDEEDCEKGERSYPPVRGRASSRVSHSFSAGSNNSVPRLKVDEILLDNSSTIPYQEPEGGLSSSIRMIRILEEVSQVCNKYFLDIFDALPPPFELSIRDWSISMASILKCRNYLRIVACKVTLWHESFKRSLSRQVEFVAEVCKRIGLIQDLLCRVINDLDEMIPLKCDEAVQGLYQDIQSVIVGSIWREEWSANSEFKKGKKVTPGALLAIAMCKRAVHDVSIYLHDHMLLRNRLNQSLLSIFIRTILNAYNGLSPSRTRQKQMQKDLTAVLVAFARLMEDIESSESCSEEEEIPWALMQQGQRHATLSFLQRGPYQCDFACKDYIVSLLKRPTATMGSFEAVSSGQCLHKVGIACSGDYGFGDCDNENAMDMLNNFLELIVLTFVNISPGSDMLRLISSIACRQKSRGGEVGSKNALDKFDDYYNTSSECIGYPQKLLCIEPLFKLSNVHLKTLHGSIGAALSRVRKFVTGYDEDMREGFSCSPADGQDLRLQFVQLRDVDMFQRIEDFSNQTRSSVIDAEVFEILVVDASYLLSLLPLHRRELCNSSYPSLSDEDLEAKALLESFMATHDNKMSTHNSVLRENVNILSESAEESCLRTEDGNKRSFEFYWS